MLTTKIRLAAIGDALIPHTEWVDREALDDPDLLFKTQGGGLSFAPNNTKVRNPYFLHREAPCSPR